MRGAAGSVAEEQGLKADIVTEQAKTRRRSTKAEQRAETMEQILDEAELLFSRHGLHGVTLKDVAKRVGVHHTLLNYYFEDKKKLFDAVFARRAVVTSTKRMQALDEYDRASGGKPTIEGALHAFLDTDLDLYIHGGGRWTDSGGCRVQHHNPRGWSTRLMHSHFDPVVLRHRYRLGEGVEIELALLFQRRLAKREQGNRTGKACNEAGGKRTAPKAPRETAAAPAAGESIQKEERVERARW